MRGEEYAARIESIRSGLPGGLARVCQCDFGCGEQRDDGGSGQRAFRKLDAAYGGLTLVGDATDVAVLRSAQIERADTVVSVTNDDNTNIMVAQIACNLYHIPNVVCRLYDPEREVVYREFGIDTICPTVLSTGRSTAAGP